MGSERSSETQACTAEPARETPRPAAPRVARAGGLQSTLGNRAVVQLLARGGGAGSVDVLRTAAAGVQGAGSRLPHLERLQRSFGGHRLDHIRAYTDVPAAAAAAAIGARAYAFGDRIAFAEPNPDVEVVAHEVTHTLQQQGGVQLKGGVGEAGDPYERQADAVGAAVARGESVAALLGPVGEPGGAASPAVQRLGVDDATARAVNKRIRDRKGEAITVDIDDRYYSFEHDKGLAAVGVASMANNPKFEAEAERFEARIGALAYNHAKSRKVCADAGAKALAYVKRKHRGTQDSLAAIGRELESFGIDQPAWSGAVGKNAAAIEQALTGGSVSEQVAHVESFVCNVLNVDLMKDSQGWQTHAGDAGLDLVALRQAQQRVQGTGDRYLAYQIPEGGASALQWHTRVGVGQVKREAEIPALPLHPSSAAQPAVKNAGHGTTMRKREQVEAAAPFGLGVKLGEGESQFQQAATGRNDRLMWEEGARVWALNELDRWVHAQRVLSLPLSAGASSTAARIMQSFAFLGVGPPDDVRLAAIGALLPARHHSLVEVMFGAQPFGTTPYTDGPLMYHQLAPLTEQEVRGVAQFYPDEIIESHVPQPQPVVQPVVAPVQPVAPARPVAPRLVPVDPEQRALADLTGGLRQGLAQAPPVFAHTRGTLEARGTSNFFKDRNSAQARMLRAIDAYHATDASDTLGRMRLLTRVRDEAAHWLSKHATWSFKSSAEIARFAQIRDHAAAVIRDHEDRYMLDLAGDSMLADSHHAYQGHTQARGDSDAKKLIVKHGLTEAECAAIAVYVGPSYKFINPGLEGERDRMMGRLLGFASETESSFSELKKEKLAAARKARQKLRALRDKKQGAIDEAHRHATVATLGLDKLPAFTGMVYAGGALTQKEAEQRFVTGQVQHRAAFASTTKDPLTARMFTSSKYSDVNDAYKLDPVDDKQPFGYILQFRSKTGRDIEAFSHKPEEHEVLFAPGSKLRIVRGAKEARPDPEQRRYKIIEAEEVV